VKGDAVLNVLIAVLLVALAYLLVAALTGSGLLALVVAVVVLIVALGRARL
jgi:NhaP-type Na+/H+ or K+/H+ antiporter